MDFRQKKTTGSTRLKANFEEEIKKISFFACIKEKSITFATKLKTKRKRKYEFVYLYILLLFLLLL